MPNHVFLSYSRADRAYVEQLVEYLTDAGVPLWYAYELEIGERFDATIQDKVDNCAAFVVILTPSSVSSKWVNLEIARAEDERKPLLPIMLLPCKPPIRLQNIHYESVASGKMPRGASSNGFYGTSPPRASLAVRN